MMVSLAAFLLFAVKKICQDIHQQIYKKVGVVMADLYDELLEKKTAELLEKQAEIDLLSISSHEIINTKIEKEEKKREQSFIKQAVYQNNRFDEHYRMVKCDFEINSLNLSLEAINELKKENFISVQDYEDLLSLFDIDVYYGLMNLNSNQQIEVINDVLKTLPAQFTIFKKYCEEKQSFDLYLFISYLKDYIFNNDPHIYIYSNKEVNPVESSKELIQLKDSEILEGYRIRYKDRLYDFSL
ncbi:MAG: hypothetical protein RR428_00280 [Coprobacillus sp.]